MDKNDFDAFSKQYDKWVWLIGDDKTYMDDNPWWRFEECEVPFKLYAKEDKYHLSDLMYKFRFAIKDYFDCRYYGTDNEMEQEDCYWKMYDLIDELNDLFTEIEGDLNG